MRRAMFVCVLLMMMVVLSACSVGQSTKTGTGQENKKDITVGVRVGNQAPAFSLLNEKDEPVMLQKLQGNVVVINFWATWCGPCRAEMPELEQFYRQKDSDVLLLGINIKEDKETIDYFMKQGGYTYPVLRDTFAQVAETYQIRGIPTTFVLDKQGIVRSQKVGPITASELKQLVEAAKK